MTIDEYLNQLSTIKSAEEKSFQQLEKLYNKATSTFSGWIDAPRSKTNENRQEIKLIEYIDAKREWEDLNKRYFEVEDQLLMDINNLLYWEGCLIYQVYIHNVLGHCEPYAGADEILHTKSQNVIMEKLKKAKSHLREILIEQGTEIE